MNFARHVLLSAMLAATSAFPAMAAEPIDIGSRLEPLVNEFLVNRVRHHTGDRQGESSFHELLTSIETGESATSPV
jgi:hypothetical protein